MMTFMAVCLALITIELGIVSAFLVITLAKLNRTAQAVEVLAYRVDQEVSEFGDNMRSGWSRALGALASFASGWLGSRKSD